MNRIALGALLLLWCATATASRYNFDYTTRGGDAVGIDRVFDDGTNTVLAFANPFPENALHPTVTSADGSVLPFRITGRYLVLPGIQQHVLVYTRGMVAQVRYGAPPPPTLRPGASAIVASPLPADPQPAPASSGALIASTPVAAAITDVDSALPAPVARAEPSAPRWEARIAGTLQETTQRWAREAGWTVRWELPEGADYAVHAASYTGDFLNALEQLYAPYLIGPTPLKVQAYSRQKVIVVSE